MNWTKEQYNEYVKRGKMPSEGSIEVKKQKVSMMTKTEMDFESTYLRDLPHYFNGLTFRMKNGCKYTPDFYIPGLRVCWEIKGSHRLHSHGRSILALRQCAVEWTDFEWWLAIKQKNGSWKRERI